VPSRKPLQAGLILTIVVYLTAAGWFFVLAPWSRFWVARVVSAAPLWLLPWLESGAVRGALSGFGVVHFAVAWAWLDTAVRQE
jgi:hypothetical protein